MSQLRMFCVAKHVSARTPRVSAIFSVFPCLTVPRTIYLSLSIHRKICNKNLRPKSAKVHNLAHNSIGTSRSTSLTVIRLSTSFYLSLPPIFDGDEEGEDVRMERASQPASQGNGVVSDGGTWVLSYSVRHFTSVFASAVLVSTFGIGMPRCRLVGGVVNAPAAHSPPLPHNF